MAAIVTIPRSEDTAMTVAFDGLCGTILAVRPRRIVIPPFIVK